MWYPYHGYSWEWMIGMGLMMILFWGGLMVLGAWAFRAMLGGGSARRSTDHTADETQRRSSGDRALEIVKDRYARGEINREEYVQMRDDLDR